MKLIVADQNRELALLSLDHPFLKFCMYLQHNELDACVRLTECFDHSVHSIFARMLLHRHAYDAAVRVRGLTPLDRLMIEIEYKGSARLDTARLEALFQHYSGQPDRQFGLCKMLAVRLH